mgnify:CR=1 FL=1
MKQPSSSDPGYDPPYGNIGKGKRRRNAADGKRIFSPVVSITDDKVDVVIHASSITDPERAQIEDIVKRKAEVGADQIIITLLNMAD